MTMRDSEDRDLEAMFAAARGAQPRPSDDLLTRVMADAKTVQPTPAIAGPRTPGPWRQVLAVLGGWRPVGGLATAAVAGLMIGYSGAGSLVAQPDLIWSEDDLTGVADLMYDDGFFELVLGVEG